MGNIDVIANSLMIHIENPALTKISEIIAKSFDPIALTVVSLIIAIVLYLGKTKRHGVFLAFVMVVCGALIIWLKELFQKERPINAIITENSFSFPSGHVTAAVVFFGLIIYLFTEKKNREKYIILASLLTILIAFTRVYLRVHWASDVLAGFLIGGLLLSTSIKAFEKYF